MVDETSPQDLFRRRLNINSAVDWVQSEVIGNAHLGSLDVSESQVRLLHSICMNGLLDSAGSYRSVELDPFGNHHQPPPVRDVPSLMRGFVDSINDKIKNGDNAIDVSAFALWRINWIHPFQNGNGRTSRQFAYFVMCMCSGGLLRGSGENLVPHQLGGPLRGDYVKALRKADEGLEKAGKEDLLPLQELLAIAVSKQLG